MEPHWKKNKQWYIAKLFYSGSDQKRREAAVEVDWE